MSKIRRITPPWAIVALAMILELAYLAYFFSFDLPNAAIPGSEDRHYSRMKVVQLAIPDFVPGGVCLASQAFTNLANTTYLPQRVPIVLHSALIVAAGFAVGVAVLRLVGIRPGQTGSAQSRDQAATGSLVPGECTACERLVLAFGIGMSALSLATLALGLVGWMHRDFVISGLIGIVLIFSVLLLRRRLRSKTADRAGRDKAKLATAGERVGGLNLLLFAGGFVAVGLFLTISYLGAMLPATDFDVQEYHMQGPKEFYLAGRIQFAPHNVYMNMPFGTEMLSLLGMIVAGDWWWGSLVGQTVLATFAPMTALGVCSLGRRLFSPAAGWLGALVYLTTPWIYRISIIPYTENALCFYLLTSTLAVVIAVHCVDGARQSVFWLLAGMLAGSAASCKYTALISTVLPLGLVALTWPLIRRLAPSPPHPLTTSPPLPPGNTNAWRTCLRTLPAFALGVTITFGPWLAKNWIMTGNPTYPLLYGIFDGRNWTPGKNAKWEWGHRVSLLVALGIQRPSNGGPINPLQSQHAITFDQLTTNFIDVTTKADWLSPLLFGLAPLALFGLRGRGAAGWLWLFVGYLFFEWWLLTHRLDRFWVPLIPLVAVLAGAGAVWNRSRLWQSFVAAVIVAVGLFNFSYSSTSLCGYNEYSEKLTARTDPLDPVINWMNQNLPETARVLTAGAASFFHLDRQVVYNTVFDDCLFEQLVKGQTPNEVSAALHRQGITHVYVSWSWIGRYREPGNYGFTEFVTPQVFEELVGAGVLRRVPFGANAHMGTVRIGDQEAPAWELYEVAPSNSP